MNVPLVTNTLTSHFRSVSPPITRQTFLQQKSPSHHALIPSHTSLSKNQSTTEPSNQTQSKAPGQLDPHAFKVFVRIRPLNSRESLGNTQRKGLSIVKKQDNMIFVFDPELAETSRKEKSYVFDDVFEETSCTADIYNEALTPAFQNMIQGFNSTIFAYGMTGAGKTFTMFGDMYGSEGGIRQHPGLINLMVQDIFQVFAAEGEKGFEFSMKLSYIEIYNEQIRDLLNPATENLMVVEDPMKGVLIPNLSEFTINSEEELLKLIITGNSRRVMASTHANQFSSRSHAIIQLLVEKRNKVRDIHETYTQSKLCFVDLAGSERAATTENRGIRMTEGANINRSLLALGNCINILSDSNKRGAFVPYRDSKLTRLLKDSLGGNTRTIMVACVSPATIAYEETVNTLSYASRARKIKKKVVSNVKEVELHVSQYKEIIESLKTEIDSLKTKLQESNEGRATVNPSTDMSQFNETHGHIGSLDKIGNSLFENLEENWEIRQNLKDLRELKTQNELSLAAKKEELEKASTNMALAESILKEITSLQEVMAYNETVESEMEASLEDNLKEKKRIQDRLLAMGSHSVGPNTYEGLERSLQSLSGNREIQKEFLDLHKEKIEKDSRIQQLEKEINEMKRQLVEKDKLLAQNDRLSTKAVSHPLSVTKAGKASSYTSRATATNISKDQLGNDNMKPKKIESQGYIPEEIRQNKDMLKKGEVIVKRPDMLPKGISEQGLPPTASKKGGKFFKGSGLNENATKTAANTIRQMVKNKYKNAIQPVSVEELKNYAEKLKGMNFEASPIAPQNQISRHQHLTVAPNSQQPYAAINRNSQRIATEVPKNSRNNINNPRHGYFNKHQRSVGNSTGVNKRGQGMKTSREGTPEKELSELSSIMMQQNEHSLDHSVDEYILNNSDEKKNRNLAEPKERKSHTNKHDLRQASSPNFHLNIMCLIKDGSNTRNSNPQNVQVSSLGQIYNEGDQYDNSKEPRSVPYLMERADSSRKESLKTNKNPSEPTAAFYKPVARQPINDLNIKAFSSQGPPIKEETAGNQQGQSNEGSKGLAFRNKNFDKIIRSENLDYEHYKHANIKHMRSTSLHPEDLSGVQKSLCSLEESSSLQRIPEIDAPKRSTVTNDIRSLEAARDIVRSFRSRLAYLSSVAEKNMLEQQHVQEISNLMKDYNENKDLLSNKDLKTLQELETAANKNLLSNKDLKTLQGLEAAALALRSQNDVIQEQKGHRSSSANVNVPRNIPLSIKDLTVKNSEPEKVYKRSTDFMTTTNETLSSGRGSVPDERPTISSQTGMVKGDPISIYNQFSMQDMPKKELEEYQSFRKSVEGQSVKGKTNIEVQNLIEKQKKNLEDFERGKKETDFSQQKTE